MSAKPAAVPAEPKVLKNYKLHVKVNCFEFNTTVSAVDITEAYDIGYKQLNKAMSKKSKPKIDILSEEETTNENGG